MPRYNPIDSQSSPKKKGGNPKGLRDWNGDGEEHVNTLSAS